MPDSQKIVPVHLLPGYVAGLHQRVTDGRTCATCDAAWPCRVARAQVADAARFTHEHWLDTDHFAQLAADVAREVKADRQRRRERVRTEAEAATA
jgi:hypothetical protein